MAYSYAMNEVLDKSTWRPESWQSKSASQQPIYKDAEHVQQVLNKLSELPPLVTSWEIEALRTLCCFCLL